MNRNNERHFNQIPEIKASRTRFNRDQTILTTFDSGKLIPFYVDEVLPGDTFNVNTTANIISPPTSPVKIPSFSCKIFEKSASSPSFSLAGLVPTLKPPLKQTTL